jgi:hypothetical protein
MKRDLFSKAWAGKFKEVEENHEFTRMNTNRGRILQKATKGTKENGSW